MDQCSRRVLAWRLAKRRDSALTAGVVAAAARRRRPAKGLIFHSDRGSEYVAAAYGRRFEALGITQSTTRRGPEDNAHMESFFHSLKAELMHGSTFTSERVLRREIDAYIRYYNRHRTHAALGYRSPVAFETAAA